MQLYFLRRVLLSIPTLFGITVLIFLAMRVLPGDPLASMSSESGGTYVLTAEQLAAARHSLGLDQPLSVQYIEWMGEVASGNLGQSFWTSENISELILRRAPITAEIAILAMAIAWLIGVPVGLFSATHRNSWVDVFTRGTLTVLLAIPSFWMGLVFILVAVTFFTWRPPLTINYLWDQPVLNLEMVIGPGIALGIGLAAATARLTRSTVLDVLHEDFVRTARAKGLRERAVLGSHVLRNAILPVVTATGLSFSGLLGGAVATETAFGVPGLGSLLVQGLNTRDWMLVQNMVLIYGLIVVVVNLAVDLSYGWIDPRIRLQ